MTDKVLLSMKGICKRFDSVIALSDISFDIKKGEVHVIIGENGAGKSTLLKIITGLYSMDEGRMEFEGAAYHPMNVRDSQAKGINMIHQELSLLNNRTVAQNIFLGCEPMKKGIVAVVDEQKMNKKCQELLDRLQLDYIKPTDLIKDLSIAQQQMVEVAKALSKENKLLIMDEPTSSLTVREIEQLFRMIRNLKEQGISIIYISHRMEEIYEIGDRITVMRDGKYIATRENESISGEELISLIVGRKLEKVYNRDYNEPGELVLRTRNLSGLRFRNVNAEVRRGEIVALAGLVGAGRTELVKAIFGNDPIEDGELEIFGEKQDIKRWNPIKAIGKGISLAPEDRKDEGLILTMPVKKNISQASLKQRFKNGIIRTKEEENLSDEYIRKLRIATPSGDKLVGHLSGGNQQKVVIAKWLATNSELLIFDEPTRGIDIGAKAEIYDLMNRLAHEGKAILMISSEQMEVVNMADRVYVMRDGEVAGELNREESHITQEAIMDLVLGNKERADV